MGEEVKRVLLDLLPPSGLGLGAGQFRNQRPRDDFRVGESGRGMWAATKISRFDQELFGSVIPHRGDDGNRLFHGPGRLPVERLEWPFQPDWFAPEVVPPFGGGWIHDRVVKPRRASRLPHQIVACKFNQLHAHFSLLGCVNGEALGTSPFTLLGGWLQLSQPQNVIFQLAQVVAQKSRASTGTSSTSGALAFRWSG